MDTRALPKGHIPGWTPPGAPAPEKKESQSKSAKKNEKRREKRKEKRQEEAVRENWDSDGDEDAAAPPADDREAQPAQVTNGTTSSQGQHVEKEELSGRNVAAAESGVDAVVDKLDKLSV